ncbi:hypothetical protein ACFZB9_15620 [Kitasatospora sp. NPDC008050]|uniref:hypothetical protein n=1 Tax=Kitasatospora sp. NPDC008050 TaxID=3364021 RepID=UPI0036EA0756
MTTPGGSMLKTSDQSIQNALMSLEGQLSAMISSGQTVERINEEIAAHYVSGASTLFQGKINDWVTRYKKIMQAFQQLSDSTQGASKTLTKAEEDAHVIGGNWGASDGVYSALNG